MSVLLQKNASFVACLQHISEIVSRVGLHANDYRKFLAKYIRYKYLLFIYHLAKINQGTQNKKVIEKSARIHLEIVYFSVRWMLSGAVKVYLVGYT